MQSNQSIATVLDARSTIYSPVDETVETRISPTIEVRKPRTLIRGAATVARFTLHFVEMTLAMMLGMAIFAPVKTALIAQGYSALLDTHSIDYQAGMNVFMVVPMVLWMRARGHGWRHGFEMGAAMMVPVAVILFVCSLGIEQIVPWFTVGLSGIAMFAGMLGYMLYRRDMYTGSYSFGWIRPRRPRA